MSAQQDRCKFLLQMHEIYWNNISRAEDACWKMIAAYTALIAGLSFSIPVIEYLGFLFVFIPFSFLSVAISLNANLWFLRNIGLISNLEKEFLKNEDYDYLIPKRWGKKLPFLNDEPWWVFTFVYFAVCLFITCFIFQKLNCQEQVIIGGLFFTCFILTVWYAMRMKDRYESFIEKSPGRSLE